MSLKKCTIYDEDDLKRILDFLKSVTNWQDFVTCLGEIRERTSLLPSHMRSEEEQQHTFVGNVEKR